jgi:peptidyl-prolyl cis-trans isomerase D
MSVIQDIRDKYAKWAVVAIALSLIGFILMDAFTGRSNIFGNSSTTVGKINGKSIDYVDFEKKVKNQEEMARQQGQDRGPEGRKEYIDNVWNEEVSTKLVTDETDELGIRVTVKEMDDYLFGSNPPQDLKQRFVDSTTGGYDAFAAQQAIAQMKRTAKPEDRAQFDQYINALILNRRFEKYNALLINSIYIPKWLVEKQNSDNSLVAKAAYVTVPYSTISDSSIKITDDEIKDYINKHKKLFEVKEETRSINYVVFNAAPSAADSNAAITFLESKRIAFDTTKDYETFIRDNNSPMGYYNSLVSKKEMKQPNKDAILSAPAGTIFGPYIDPGQNGSYAVISKILEVRNIPDTVKVRHILISTHQQDPQTGLLTPVRDSATAKKITDSVRSLLASGQPFDSLVVKFSEDPGSKDKGGVYENVVANGRMTSKFNDFIFTRSVGEVGVIQTEFGFHIIEVLSQKGSTPAYKLAFLSAPIVASQETDNIANTAATNFASESRSEKSFNENFSNKLQKQGYTKLVATNIHPNDFSIQSLGVSRELVKDIFEAKQGEVLQPQRVGEAYIVAVVTGIDEAGLQSVATARASVEPMLRNKKKAEQIRKKIGKVTTLEAAATAVGQPVITADSLRFAGSNTAMGFEFRLLGAAFNPDNKGKVVPEVLEGQTGVYVLRVDGVSAIAGQNANLEETRTMMRMQQRQSVNPVEGLKTAADIKDNRAKFF